MWRARRPDSRRLCAPKHLRSASTLIRYARSADKRFRRDLAKRCTGTSTTVVSIATRVCSCDNAPVDSHVLATHLRGPEVVRRSSTTRAQTGVKQDPTRRSPADSSLLQRPTNDQGRRSKDQCEQTNNIRRSLPSRRSNPKSQIRMLDTSAYMCDNSAHY